jgi:hypothetical protein
VLVCGSQQWQCDITAAVQRHSGSIFLNFKACDASTVCTEISSAIRFEVRCGNRGVEFIPLPNLRISRQDRAIFLSHGEKNNLS